VRTLQPRMILFDCRSWYKGLKLDGPLLYNMGPKLEENPLNHYENRGAGLI